MADAKSYMQHENMYNVNLKVVHLHFVLVLLKFSKEHQ